MNSGYSVAQRDVLPKNIKQEVGYLGPHDNILGVEDEQHMVFKEGGYGLLWMTPQ